MCCAFCCFPFWSARRSSQQPNAAPAQAPSAQAPGTIRVATQMVVEEVTVKDKSGKPIEGLTANDFSLTEDGVPQTISFVEFQRLQAASNSAEPSPAPSPVVPTAAARHASADRAGTVRATLATATTACWLCTSTCPPCSLRISCGPSTPR